MTLFKKKGRPTWYYEKRGYIKQTSLYTTDKRKAMMIAHEFDEMVLRMKNGLMTPEEFNLRKTKKIKIDEVYKKFYDLNIKKYADNKRKTRYTTSKLKPFVEKYKNKTLIEFNYEMACEYREYLLSKNGKGYTTKTANNHLSVIKMMFEWAVNSKYIANNPFKVNGFLPSTKPKNPRKPIPVEHIVDAIAVTKNESDKIYWTVLLHTGLRRHDAGTLTPDDVERGIFQKKSGEYRAIFVTDELKRLGDKIYNAMPTKRKQQDSLERFQAIIMERHGYKTDFHSIRHTVFTMLVNNGFDENQVGKILGTESSVGTYAKTDINRATQTINKLIAES